MNQNRQGTTGDAAEADVRTLRAPTAMERFRAAAAGFEPPDGTEPPDTYTRYAEEGGFCGGGQDDGRTGGGDGWAF